VVTCVNLLQASSVLAPHAGELFPQQLQLEGDRFPAPDTPGLRVDVDEEAMAAQDFRFWEAPHLRRRDGSYTNW
jgi:galactonate dehydratase